MSSTTLPDADALVHASALNVIDFKGERLTFGSIIEGQKTIVVFISSSTQFSIPIILPTVRRAFLLWRT